jgi:hypothetical protein
LGIDDFGKLGKLALWQTYMAIDAAVEHRGWSQVQAEGEPMKFRKAATVTEYRKLAESATACERRRQRA